MSIVSFEGKHEFLSNFFPCELFYDGLWFNTTEAAFQAAKCMYKSDAQHIASCATPGQAKRMGRKIQMRSDWEQVKNSEMLRILRIKFTRGSELADKLEATGHQTLVEGTRWHDNYWGVCTCPKCSGEGVNMLGQILMHIRNENRQGIQLHFQPSMLPRKDWIFPS